MRIAAEATRRPLAALLAGRLDVAVMHSPVDDPRLHVEPLFRDELVLVVAPEHPLARRSFARPEDLAGEHLIVYSEDDEESVVQREVLAPARVRPARVSRIQLTEGIVEMVKAGLGVSVLARWAVAPQLESGDLRALRLTKEGRFRRWSAATHGGAADAPHLSYFIAVLRERALPAARNPRAKGGTR